MRRQSRRVRLGLQLAQAIVFCCIIVAVLWAVPALVSARLGPVSAGDILQYAGALLGSATAVAGAISVESWKRGRQNQRDIQLLRGALWRMRDMLWRLGRTAPEGNPEHCRREALENMEWFEDSMALLVYAKAQVRIPNDAVFICLRPVERALDRHKDALRGAAEMLRRHGPATQQDLDFIAKEMGVVAAETIPTIEVALDAIVITV